MRFENNKSTKLIMKYVCNKLRHRRFLFACNSNINCVPVLTNSFLSAHGKLLGDRFSFWVIYTKLLRIFTLCYSKKRGLKIQLFYV